jgi:hypothetical protein
MSLRKLPAEGVDKLIRTARASWKPEIAALAGTAYQAGRTVTEAFLHLAQTFLAPEGVLFVEGFSAAAWAQPLLRRLASEGPRFQKALAQGSRRSEDQGFPLQVPMRPGTIPAFLLDNRRRRRLFFEESGDVVRLYTPGAEGQDLSADLEQLTLLHSALSRPLVAESLFPVLGHVLGPAELRYFAQLSEVFPAFGFSMPPVAPRQQTLVCPEKEWRRLQDLGIQPGELPETGPSRLRARLTEKAWLEHPASANFPKAAFDEFSGTLRRYQSNLPGTGGLEAGMRRLEKAFGRYREAARQAVFTASAAKTHASMLPLLRWLGNGAQDRHLNLLSLRNAMGEGNFAQWAGSLRSEAAELSITLF